MDVIGAFAKVLIKPINLYYLLNAAGICLYLPKIAQDFLLYIANRSIISLTLWYGYR